MNIRYIIVAVLSVFAFLGVRAQETLITKYAFAPSDYQSVFLDYVQNNPSKIITTSNGQYVGQVDENNMLCGYGMFVNNDGSTIIGQFNKGRLLFGITLASDYVRVGSESFYANYSQHTGHLDYICRMSSDQIVDTKGLYDYAFVSMTYANGDQYVGELYKQKRHGYGIYYYANGDIWFGEYNNDIRHGYGALINKNNKFTLGYWEAEDMRRVINVKSKD